MEGFDRSLAFIIAIDNYSSGVPRLRTPVADAKALAKCLREDHGFETELILNSAATLGGLRTFLSGLPDRVGGGDRVLFYFAGHGIATPSDTGPTGYILPQDADQNTSANYLPMLELDTALSALPCRHMLVILDCCFAGAFQWASTRYLALSPEHLHQERYRWFIEDPAWQAIASAAHDQKALDIAAEQPLGKRGSTQNHSPFAAALVAGLKGLADLAAAGQTGDGVITATELYQHLDEALRPQGAGAFRQTPTLWPLKKHDKGQFVFLVPGRELDLPPAPVLDEDANPWRGLEPYEPRHAELFFGRGEVSKRLLQRVLDESFIVVTGPSGIGKSSLVRAGLLPRLEDDAFEPIVVRPGPTPFASLARALAAATPPGSIAPDETSLRSDPNALATWATTRSKRGAALLVIDQAEELITMNRDDAVTKDYLTLVDNALREGNGRLRIVFTVRSEFEPQFAQSPLKARWPRARFLVPPMTQDELRRVIENPAAVKVMRFEPSDLIDDLVNEVIQMPGALPLLSFALSQMYNNYLKRRSNDRILTDADYQALEGGVAGSLRVRANELVGVWDKPQETTARRVLQSFLALEAVHGLLIDQLDIKEPVEDARARRVVQRMEDAGLLIRRWENNQLLLQLGPDAKSSDENDLFAEVNKAFDWYQQTARRVLERFVSVDIGEFARRRVSRKEFEEDDPGEQARVNKILERLVEARLLVSDEVGDEAFLELAHDALILGWDRLLTWVREDSSLIAELRRMTPEALKWAGSHEASLLWSDAARLDDVRKLQANVSPGLNKTEADFARASVKRARQNSFIRWGLAAVLAIVTAAAIGYATLASVRERIATSRQLASESESSGRQQLDLSLLLGIEAATARPTVEAWSALLGALTEQPRLTAFLHIPNLSAGKYIQSLSFSPNGLQIAAGCLDGSVILWDIKTGRAIEPFLREPEPGSGVVAIAFSPDGEVLAAGTQKGEILFWSVRTHDPLPTLSDSVVKNHDTIYNSVEALVFLDNQQLATGRDDGRVEIWDLKDRKLSRAFGDLISPEENAHRDGVQSLAYDASSGILAAGYGGAVAGFVGPDSSIYLWNSRGNFAPVHSIPAGKGGVRGLTFVPKTSFLTWGREDGTIGIYDVQRSVELSPLEGGPRSVVTTLASSFDGRFLVSGSLDGSLMIWDFDEKKPVDTPIRASGRTIAGVSFSRNGDVVATGGSDGNVALWDIIAHGPGERLPESPQGVKMLAGSRSGRWLAGVTYTGNVELWDIVAKSRHQIYEGRDNRAEYVLADGDADAFLIFTSNRIVFRCDSTRCDEDARASELKEAVLPESFSAPGGFEWIEIRNSPVEFRQCSEKGCVPLTFPDSKPDAVHTIAITGDGDKLALAEDYDVYLCTKHKCHLVPLKLDWQSSESVGTIAFSPDGQLLILGTGAGHIYFIDAVSGLPLGIPAEAHRGFLEHLAFSADSKIMASGGRDGMVKLWDLNSQRLLGRLALRPAGSVRQVAALTFVGSNGSLAVTYTEDLGPVLLRADLDSLASRACRIANRNLSLAEWGQFLGDASCRSTCSDVVNCRSWLPRPPAPPSAVSSER